ncbi:MAG TPA: hypothetical protein VGO86_10395 [Candidatus Dormibacteraeota bacterium]|jgi:hypothetical protein
MTTQPPTAVYLEVGRKRVFACALDWPGWCRAGRNEEQALAALDAYRPRYAPVAQRAGLELPPGAALTFDVVERLPGTAGYTDFGAPGEIATSDTRPIGVEEARRLASLVEAAWATFDSVVERAPAELRKGPRGGGRDRDRMVEHVLGAEAAYARKLGVRHRQPAAGDRPAILALRTALIEALSQPSNGTPSATNAWPHRYAARRIAWHVLDHAWEIEDRSIAESG